MWPYLIAAVAEREHRPLQLQGHVDFLELYLSVVLDGISTFDARCSDTRDTRIDRPSMSHAYFSRFLLVQGILEGLDVSSPRTS
jgi:hypothetical protein